MQYDVKNAFLHANIDTEIYITLPIGLYNNNKYKNKVAKLNKALYSLKQAPRLWNKYLSKILKGLNFEICPYDEGVYINKELKIIIICYVDDMLIISAENNNLLKLENNINKHIEIEKIGPPKSFLGNDI